MKNSTTTGAIRVLSKESITGEPREVKDRQATGGASFDGNFNENLTPEIQSTLITNSIKNIDGYLDLIKQSASGTLEYGHQGLFKPGELINLNGIYMNNALNYLWGSSLAEIQCNNKTAFGPNLNTALLGAQVYNKWDKVFGRTRTWNNQPNHHEAIIRGYLNNSMGSSSNSDRLSNLYKSKIWSIE